MQFHQHVLANGLTLLGETNPHARSVALGFFVSTGARDETPAEDGVTHFLEHMIFKGTPNRTADQVNRDFDRIGAAYNAYTSEENTVFHAAVLPEYLPTAVDVLTDILRPSLRGTDFDMEKNVILEEIGMYDDQPMWAAYDVAKRLYFNGHPLGSSVLGTKESVGALTRDQMQDYFDRRYVAPNITVVATGNYEWQELVRWIGDRCSGWPRGDVKRAVTPACPGDRRQVIRRENVVQEHTFMLSAGPAADDPLRYAAEVLANAIGDDTGSRFYWSLVDPGHVEAADCSYHEYHGAGVFYSYFSSDPELAAQNIATIRKVLREVREHGLTDEEIRQAKTKIGSRIVRSGEKPMGRMQALGFAWTYLNSYRTVDDDLAAIDAVDKHQIRHLLEQYPFEPLTTVALGPLPEISSA